MADYFLQFSEIVPHLTNEELQWLRASLAKRAEKDDWPGFEYRFDEDRESGANLWLYADTNGDPDQVARFVQKFLKKFRPNEYWALTYAESCSKPRIGAFGGGGVFVTARKIEAFNVVDFIFTSRLRFNRRRPAVTC